HEEVLRVLGMDLPVADWAKEEGIADAEIIARLTEMSNRAMAEKAVNFGPDVMRTVEKSLLLQLLDQTWKEHLLTLDHLRQGIGLRAYGQRDPLNEYKSEAFDLFSTMLENLRETVTQTLIHIELQFEPTEEDLYPQSEQEMIETREDPAFQGQEPTPEQLAMMSEGEKNFLALEKVAGDRPMTAPMRSREAANVLDPDDTSTWGRVSRNQTCPCGSGKKYKHCHGKLS
ncbi:MAG: preprotein translocase subunit SecA, partial [Rhodospirillaceae bacterium]|nr:preprotein translocase subunit SecA [Rhodospirillaceae bacterium]